MQLKQPVKPRAPSQQSEFINKNLQKFTHVFFSKKKNKTDHFDLHIDSPYEVMRRDTKTFKLKIYGQQ